MKLLEETGSLGKNVTTLCMSLPYIMELFDKFRKSTDGFQLPQGVLRKKAEKRWRFEGKFAYIILTNISLVAILSI